MNIKLFNPQNKPLPPGAVPCFYVSEQEKNNALLESRNFHPDISNTPNYFFIQQQPAHNILRGFLGRTDRAEPFLENFDRGLEYFLAYLERKEIYFSLNRVDLYQVTDIIPRRYKYLLMTWQKVNTRQMKQDLNPNITINAGDSNIITTGHHNTITATVTLLKGDIESLRSTLKKYGVPQDDINEISTIVHEESPDQAGNFGPKTDGWIRKMYRKALDGGWEVSINTAGGLLVEAIKAFFGI